MIIRSQLTQSCIRPCLRPRGSTGLAAVSAPGRRLLPQNLYGRWQPRTVAVDARRSRDEAAGGDDADGTPGYAEELDSLPYNTLKTMCKDLGIPSAGKKKVELVEALEAHRLASAQAEGGGQAQEQDEEGEEEAEEGGDDDPIKQQLREMSSAEIIEILEARGEDVSGDHEDLVDRLAAILAPELERELEIEARGEGAEEEEGPAGGGEVYVDDALRERLVRERATQRQALYDGMSRPQVYKELKAVLPHAHYTARDDLVAQLCSIGAEKEVQEVVAGAPYNAKDAQTLQQWIEALPTEAAAAARSAAAAAAPVLDSATYARLTVADIRKMRVKDLRDALAAVGRSCEGNRYEMVERLLDFKRDYEASGAGAEAGGEEAGVDGMAQIKALSLRELRAELGDVGLSGSGSRSDMEHRLYDFRNKRSEKAAAATAAAKAKADSEDGVTSMWTRSMCDVDLRTVTQDPDLTVAVVFGAPGGDLDEASASVAAAQGLMEALFTAPLPRLVDSPVPTTDELGVEGRLPLTELWRLHASGIQVAAFYVDRRGGALHAVSPQQLLAATGAAAIEAELAAPSEAQEFAAPLVGHGCQVVLPVLSGLPTSPELLGVSERLQACGLPCMGLADASAAAVAADKWSFIERLRGLGYPTLPTYHLAAGDLAEADQVPQRIANWCSAMSYDLQYQQLLLKPCRGRRGSGFVMACGAAAAAESAVELLQLLSELDEGAAGGVVVQPWMGKGAIHFSCLVLEGPGGPLALLPSEIEIEDIDDAILDTTLDWHKWQLQLEGVAEPDIEQELREVRATMLPAPQFKTFSQGRQYLPNQTVHYHCPPRLSRKVLHHIRHASAKLFLQLGLRDVARVQGWVLPQPGWDAKYQRSDADIPPLADIDLEIMEKMAAEEERVALSEPHPLADYYDDFSAHTADLSAFDPSQRLDAAVSGGEASVLISDVHLACQLAVDLAPGGLAEQQAAELGMSRRGLARALLSSALRRGEAGEGAGLPALPAGDVYASAPLAPLAPDTWDLLLEMREQREDEQAAMMGHNADLEDAVNDMEEVLVLMHDNLEAAFAEEEQIQAAEALGEDNLQYDDPELSVRIIDRWEPHDDDADDFAVPQPDGSQGDEGPARIGLSAPPGSILALKEAYPELQDDDLMRLYLGETRTGQRLDRKGFLAVARTGPTASSALLADLEAVEDVLEYEEGEEEEEEEGEAGAVEVEAMAAEEGEECGMDVEVVGEAGEGESPALAGEAEEGEEAGEAEADEGEVEVGEAGEAEAGEGEGEEEVEWSEQLPAEVREELLAMGMPPVTVDADVPRAVKVWVLMGGDVNEADASLASGLEVVRRLSQFSDLQVEPFMIAGAGAGEDTRRRRAALLKLHNEQLSHGCSPDELPEHLQLHNIRDMEGPEVCLESEHVWALTPAVALQSSAEAVIDACERSLKVANTNEPALSALVRQGLEARWDVQMELEEGGVQGVGELWGGAYDARLPVPPRLLSLGQFAEEAVNHDAVVFLSTRGPLSREGRLHRFLDIFGVTYTGSSAHVAAATSSKAVIKENLQDLEERGISSPPQLRLPLGFLEEIADSEGLAELALSEAREAIFEDEDAEAALSLAPEVGSQLGAARVASAEDLALYCRAVAARHPFVPAGALGADAVMLPRRPPEGFVVEPFVETDPVHVRPGAEGGLSWAGEQRWVAVTIGLLGVLGNMQAMGPSLVASLDPELVAGGSAGTEDDMPASASASASEVVHVAPVPESVCAGPVLAQARQRAVEVADWLGMSGLAQLDAFMHVDTGELVVLDVDIMPDLTPASPLYVQAAQHSDDPKYPHELLRAVVMGAMAESVEAGAEGEADELLGDEEEDEDAGFLEDGEDYAMFADVEAEDDSGVGSMKEDGDQEEPEYQENWK